jgi:hypothetical protein
LADSQLFTTVPKSVRGERSPSEKMFGVQPLSVTQAVQLPPLAST